MPFAPVKVILGKEPSLHTEAADPDIVAVGRGFTLTVTLPAWVLEQDVELASLTLTSAYVYEPSIPVGTGTVAVFPVLIAV